MATKFEDPSTASETTHVVDMPPLDVVTEGIPAQEHIELAPAGQVEATSAVREGRRRMWAWALAGALGLMLVVAGVFAVTQYSSTGESDLSVVPPPVSQELPADVPDTPALPSTTRADLRGFRFDGQDADPTYTGPLVGPELLPRIRAW